MNPTFVATSYPPKTHCSLTRCPTLYFLRTNKHSSISTVCPGPPMTTGFLIKYCTYLVFRSLEEVRILEVVEIRSGKHSRSESENRETPDVLSHLDKERE
ncbi:hypothetical protein EMCRGX_G007019 [Ephydatia muelleri]